MEWQAFFLVSVLLLALLLLAGQWIAYALGVAGLVLLYLDGGTRFFQPLGDVIWNAVNNFTLIAIPLFIFMGEIVLRGGISERFYRAMGLLFARLPGGLLQVNIISCGIFAALTGVSVASAAAIATVAIPELSKQGYDRKMIFGSLAGGGTLGILIPPSVPFIVYGALAQESIIDLFAAGILPGILMMLVFMAYIAARVLADPQLAPKSQEFTLSGGDRAALFLHILPVLSLIFLVLGGIYFGVMTPTEAAAVGALLSLVLAGLYGKLTVTNLSIAIAHTVQTTSMILFIMIGASIFSFALVNGGINRELTEWVVSFGHAQHAFFAAICVIYLVLGCFFDPISILVLTMPIVYPIMLKLGFDPVWFGVILVILMEIGLITPPVGFNLFVIHATSGGRPIGEVIRGSLPYVMLMLGMIVLLYAFPQVALWIPRALK